MPKLRITTYNGYDRTNISIPKRFIESKKWKHGQKLYWLINDHGELVLSHIEPSYHKRPIL